jgi:hypothetical protein
MPALSGAEQARAKALCALFNRAALGTEFQCGAWTVIVEQPNYGAIDAKVGAARNGEPVAFGSALSVSQQLALAGLTAEGEQLLEVPVATSTFKVSDLRTPPIPTRNEPQEDPMPRGVYDRTKSKPRTVAAKTTKPIPLKVVETTTPGTANPGKFPAGKSTGRRSVAKRPATKTARKATAAAPAPLLPGTPAPITTAQALPASVFAAERARIEHALEILQGQLELLNRLEGVGV